MRAQLRIGETIKIPVRYQNAFFKGHLPASWEVDALIFRRLDNGTWKHGAWLGLKAHFSCSYGARAVGAFIRTPNSSRCSAELFNVGCVHFSVRAYVFSMRCRRHRGVRTGLRGGCLHFRSSEVVWVLEQYLIWQPLDPCDLLDPLKKPFHLASSPCKLTRLKGSSLFMATAFGVVNPISSSTLY